MEIKVVHQPNLAHLNELDVFNWPIWEKEISKFSWTYDDQETCYFLAGNALVTFPAGMSCTWEITRDVRKHYCFD